MIIAILTLGSAQRSAAQSGVGDSKPDIVLSDATPTASFTSGLSNNGLGPVEIWQGLACSASSDSGDHADPVASAWHNQSSCAIPWLSGYPQHVVLAPHEQQPTFSMQAIPSSTLPDGHYTARLIWAVLVQHGVMHGEYSIIYDKGPQPPRRARAQWRTTVVSTVSHTPDVLVLDDRTRTATFTLNNPGAMPIELWLAVDCPWFRVNFMNYPDSHQYESAWHGRIPSAAFWLSGYPQHVILAPHERRTLSIQAFPNIAGGKQSAETFYARLVYVQSPILTVTASGDTTYSTPQGTINMVYHKGAPPSPLTLSQLQRNPRPDGTSQACMMVQQPGIGVVAVLHAEVDDAHGHPVSPRTSAGSVGGSHPSPWEADTTVAVWEVVHHNPMDGALDGEPKAPDPICFTLPSLAPGHYQLAVSAYELEDTAKYHPVQAMLPLEIP